MSIVRPQTAVNLIQNKYSSVYLGTITLLNDRPKTHSRAASAQAYSQALPYLRDGQN